jgi:Sec-independent protein secretion pathway component TatC
MWGFTFVAVAFALALVVMSGAFMGGAVIVAVPLAILFVLGAGLLDLRRRRNQAQGMEQFRQQADSEKIDFTARDRQTLS